MPITGPSIKALVARSSRLSWPDQFPPRPPGYVGHWPSTVEDVEAGRTPWLWIDPFDPACVGPNSYDVTLGPKLLTYRPVPRVGAWANECNGRLLNPDQYFLAIDPEKDNPTDEHIIPRSGYPLLPGVLYLGTTNERVFTRDIVPNIDGRSSVGRCGLSIHVTAGRGDFGFCGALTLEMTVVHDRPVVVRPNMRLGQLTFEIPDIFPGVAQPAHYRGRYQGQTEPVPSRFHLPTLTPSLEVS